jgi:hypothetical protein
MESLAYTLVYLVNGKLPWQGIRSSQNTNHLGMVLDQKRNLCKPGSSIVPPLANFLHYTQSLVFEEKPDYIHLHVLIEKLAI